MKKLIILIISLFMLTGCYDHIGLDELSLISGIGIDYQDDEFLLTYEIYNVNQTSSDSVMLSYTVNGKGKTIGEAFTNTNYKTGNIAYYPHMNILLLSENVIKDHLEEITDYLFRNIYIRDEFTVAITKDIKPKDLLNKSSDSRPVVSEFLKKTLDNTKYNNDMSITDTFQDLMKKLISDKQDIILNSVVYNDDEITLGNSYIFKKYKYVDEISRNETILYNILIKEVNEAEFKNTYDNKDFLISLTYSNCDTKVAPNKLSFDLNLDAKIIENNANLDLKDIKTYEMLNNDFNEIIKKDIINFIKKLQNNNSDILGLRNIYYKKNNKDLKDLWTHADIDVNVNLKVNTKGFIFEVER